MLSNNLEIQYPEEKEFDPIPEGMYQCRISAIKEVEGKKYMSSEMEMKIQFEFTILEGVAVKRKIWKKIAPKFSEPYEGGKPSGLYILLRNVLGRIPTRTDATVDSINNLIGKQVLCIIKQDTGKDGKLYNNISDFLPAKKDIEGDDIFSDIPPMKEDEPEE